MITSNVILRIMSEFQLVVGKEYLTFDSIKLSIPNTKAYP